MAGCLLGERVDSLGQREIELGQSTFGVGRTNQTHFIKANVDVGMMLFVFRDLSHRIYKVDRIGKLIELERPLDVLLLQLPFWNLFQAGFQLVRFDQVSHNRERVTPQNAFANEIVRPSFR